MVVVSLIMRLIAGAALMILVAALAFLFEGVDRVVHARMQRRIGPPVFQPFLDLVKLLGKENIVPRRAVAWAFNGAPWVAAAWCSTCRSMAGCSSAWATMPTAAGACSIARAGYS